MALTPAQINSYLQKAQRSLEASMLTIVQGKRSGKKGDSLYFPNRFLSAGVDVLNSNHGLTNLQVETIVQQMIECGELNDFSGDPIPYLTNNIVTPSSLGVRIVDLLDGPMGSLTSWPGYFLRVKLDGSAWEWVILPPDGYVNITYAALAILKSGNGLIPSVIYFITDRNIYIEATSTNGLSTECLYKATNADYNNVTTQFIGVWTGTTLIRYDSATLVGAFSVGELVTGGTSGAQAEIVFKVPNSPLNRRISHVISKNGTAFTVGETITGATSGATCVVEVLTVTTILGTIANNKIVSWNNLHYKNITGSATIKHPKYDTTNWLALATTDSSYQIEYDEIIYDFPADKITSRRDMRGNIVVDSSTVPNSINKFQWGRNATHDNEIFSFGFEGWNAATAQVGILNQDSALYISDTSNISFAQITGRSTVAMMGPSGALAPKVFHGSGLIMTNGGANEVYVESFGEVTVYDSGANAGNSTWINARSILTGTSTVSGCSIDGGDSFVYKNFASESFANKVYKRNVISTFNTTLTQTSALTTLTLIAEVINSVTNYFYGVYNVTITGGGATIDTIANMPPVMAVEIIPTTVNTITFVNGGAGSIYLKGIINKTFSPATKDWIIFQIIGGVTWEFNSTSTISSISSSPIPVLNALFVSKSGNDGTAITGRFDKPYLTITAAQAAASSGQTIIVYPGTYSTATGETFPLGKAGLNYHFINGVVVSSTTSTMWVDTGVISYSISGDGELTSTSGIIASFTTGGVLTMAAKRLSNTSSYSLSSAGASKIYATIQKDITTTTGQCFGIVTAGELYVSAKLVTSAGLIAVSSEVGNIFNLTSNLITCTGNTGAFQLAGTNTINGALTYTGTGDVFALGGALVNINCYSDITHSNSTSLCNLTIGTTGNINFYGILNGKGNAIVNGFLGTVSVYNDMTTSIATAPSISMTSGTVAVRNCRIKNSDANAASYAITKTTGTLILQNAILITSGGTECVHSAAAQNMTVYNSVANVAVSVNITQKVSSVLIDAQVV